MSNTDMVVAFVCFWLVCDLPLPSGMSSSPGEGGELGHTGVPASVESWLGVLIGSCMPRWCLEETVSFYCVTV